MVSAELIVGPAVGWTDVETVEGACMRRRPERDAYETARPFIASRRGKARDVDVDRAILKLDTVHQRDGVVVRARRLSEAQRLLAVIGDCLLDDADEFEPCPTFHGDLRRLRSGLHGDGERDESTRDEQRVAHA